MGNSTYKQTIDHATIRIDGVNEGHYEGPLVNGKPHGRGKCTYKKGDVYVGNWANGVRYGQGKIKYRDNNVYEGEFDDTRHGWGKCTYSNGDVYEGEWQDGRRHGRGKITEGGVTTEGTWKFNQKHGVWIVKIVNKWYLQNWDSGFLQNIRHFHTREEEEDTSV
jgi:hypothetical protein